MKHMPSRIASLDLLRSCAVVSMIAYHLAWDMSVFAGIPILGRLGLAGDVWARATAATFLLLVGVGFALSWERLQHRAPSISMVIRKYGGRGLGVLACAMLVTLVTYVFDPQTYVRFGVLHCIGVGIILLPMFAKLGRWNIVIGCIVIISAFFPFIPLFPSIPYFRFPSIDYFPLIPWLGVMLLGYGLAPWIIRLAQWADGRMRIASWMTWPGRRALLMYMVHQPILVSIVMLMKIVILSE
jgi:uncharacterized membrane protein